jgi:hypothetical protein
MTRHCHTVLNHQEDFLPLQHHHCQATIAEETLEGISEHGSWSEKEREH